MQAQQSALITGDEELRRVAQRCLGSEERYSFVVGPSRSGKSTRLPVILAGLSRKKVICVQPNDWVAQYHATWIDQSIEANTYDGKRVTVGFQKDEEESSIAFVPQYDVTYMSYKWLYRMFVAANDRKLSLLHDEDTIEEHMTKQTKVLRATLKTLRAKSSPPIGFVILDEVHAQSVTQELGYIALHAATSNIVEAPIGFKPETKVITTTAYPQNDTFQGCFGLSNVQIDQRTIKIDRGLAPTPRTHIRETYCAGSVVRPFMYHISSIRATAEIFKTNPNARVLLILNAMCSTRNIVRQSLKLQRLAKVFDLETASHRSLVFGRSAGPIIVLATSSFASRIPVRGITDVICPPNQLLPALSKQIHRQVLVSVELALWELAWAKSHLDPACRKPTIHYFFPSDYHSQLIAGHGARFRGGDFVDLLIGVIRIGQNAALRRRTPLRFDIPLEARDRALRQLTTPPVTVELLEKEDVTEFFLTLDGHAPIMANLWDRYNIDRRQGFFFGRLQDVIKLKNLIPADQRFATMVAICMAVFGEDPILRKAGPSSNVVPERLEDVFGRIHHTFYLGGRTEFTSDSWINAVVWMDFKRRAIDRRSDFVDFVLLELLAKALSLDEASKQALCNGSFLGTVELFNQANTLAGDMVVDVIWQSHMETYQYDLAYVTYRQSVNMVDICSGVTIDYAPNFTMVDLLEQAEKAKKNHRDGFYVTGTAWVRLELQNLTVVPKRIICKITDGSEAPWDIRSHLQLDPVV
ncbi:hypothetical protein NUW58_g816 [Xylaria curta]|uniref:Uncharacterized protein n=1 Tax=Xylaria curta TaxID=42375 RepID=A0ACC1PPV0_9PEZI|nr:hypothetical protein NUW58_g816 [Xylaria curta]